MATAIKSSVRRIREILSGNIGYFSTSFLAVFLILGVISLLDYWFFKINDYLPAELILVVVIVALFVTPTLSHGLAYVSTKSRGVEEIRQNATRLKKNLFGAFGIFWASLGIFFIMFAWQASPFTGAAASALSLVCSWWFMSRIIISYVKGI